MARRKYKFLILAILFVAPLVFFLFLASGKVNFEKLPVITKNVALPKPLFTDKITVLCFLSDGLEREDYFQLLNLYQIIYKPLEKYKKFQIVTFYLEGISEKKLQNIKKELARAGAADLKKWFFIPQKNTKIQNILGSFELKKLQFAHIENRFFVFLIDQNLNLRARVESENNASLFFAYPTHSVAALKNKLKDDILVLLYESKFARKYEK